MSVENKRMQQRSGTYAQFTANLGNMLPNEFASITSGADTTSGKALYFCPDTGEAYRLLAAEDKIDIENYVDNELSDVTDNLEDIVYPQLLNEYPEVTVGFDVNGIPRVVLTQSVITGGGLVQDTNITKLFVPSTVTRVGGGTFYACSSLTDVYIYNSQSNTVVENGAFSSGVNIHYDSRFNSITQIIKAINYLWSNQ